MFRSIFSLSIIDLRPGFVCLQVSGKKSYNLFKNEAGGHRWQRIPPTERRGRKHTSTITVAVLREPTQSEVKIDQNKLKITTCKGSGPGGQHRNTTDSAVQIQYEDITIRCESERSQHQNKATALCLLRAKILEKQESLVISSANKKRKDQIGSGMRGDKRRTIRVFDDQVVDHESNKTMKYSKYKRGNIKDIH